MRRLLPVIILLFSCVYAVLPLFGSRFIPTHDGEYHIIRFYEFFTMLAAGYPFPRWAPGLNSGYGIPLFNFHYPFPNYIGSLLHALGFSFVDAFEVAEAFGYLIAILFCYLWLRKLFPIFPAVVGAIICAFIPYWFVDLYIRGAIGEVWAMAWVFLAFAAIEYNARSIFPLALGLLILSHNILAMLFIVFILTYLFLRKKNWILEVLLGIFLASYFWLPALLERNLVSGLNIVKFHDHFPELYQLVIPSWGSGFSQEGVAHDEMSFQIGIVPLIVMLAAFLKAKSDPDNAKKTILTAFFFFFIGLFFLMQKYSLFFWKNIPVLQYIQYPWRLLSMLFPIVAYCGAYVVSMVKHRKAVGMLLICLAIFLSLRYIKPVTYELRSDQYYLTKREFTDGTSSLANTFSTRLRPWIEERAPQKIEVLVGEATITQRAIRPLEYIASLSVIKDSILRVHLLYYPGWQVYVDGHKVNFDTRYGLMDVSVSPQNQDIRVVFEETMFRKIANALSILSLFWILVLAILKRYGRRNRYLGVEK